MIIRLSSRSNLLTKNEYAYKEWVLLCFCNTQIFCSLLKNKTQNNQSLQPFIYKGLNTFFTLQITVHFLKINVIMKIFTLHKYTKMQEFRAFIHKSLHNGCPCQARTDDTRINSPLLYRLS